MAKMDEYSLRAYFNNVERHHLPHELIRRYIEKHEADGATAYQARDFFGLARQSATARCTDILRAGEAFPVECLHELGFCRKTAKKRPTGTSRTGQSAVLLGREWVSRRFGPRVVEAVIPLAQEYVRKRERRNRPPTDELTEAEWETYLFVHSCGRNGITADEAEKKLEIPQGNYGNRLSPLRTLKALIPITELHKIGEFLDVPKDRRTRHLQGAGVVVSFHTVLNTLEPTQIDRLLLANEIDHLEKVLVGPGIAWGLDVMPLAAE